MTSSMRCTRARTRCCAPRSSTTGGTRSPRRRSTWRRAVPPCASVEAGPRARASATVEDLRASGQALLARLRELPGGSCLLELAAGRDDVELIGGATRDLLLSRSPRELDVVVDGDAASFAAELAAKLPGPGEEEAERSLQTTVHERFGTALVSFQSGRIDVAARRSESYPAPGALPEVRAGTPDEDLARRDFTINAIAVALGGPRAGGVRAAPHALEDLAV